jgi:SRSO17 transposase
VCQRVCPAYIAGLIRPADRKSVQPMAARDGKFGFDQIHHFVTDGVWSSPSLQAVRLQEVNRLVGDKATYLVIDDAALSKKGDYEVGVAAQYVFEFGKTSNCQSLLSVILASREVPVMIGLRLFFPKSCTVDVGR